MVAQFKKRSFFVWVLQEAKSSWFLSSFIQLRLGPDEVILGTHLMSMDPTMRNAMAGEEGADRTQAGLAAKSLCLFWTVES